MLESMDTINSLRMISDVSRYMFFEKRRFSGTHHFYGLLHAIKNRIVIKLVHKRFEFDEPTERLVEPLALKESKGRWYLFAKDRKDKKYKTFGLDRVLDFESTPWRFDYPPGLDVHKMFQNYFGVITQEDEDPEELILSFTPEQGKYVQSYPLHESQTILENSADEFRIRLEICITHDLIMELLSMGETMKVLKPEWLVKDIIERLERTIRLYRKPFRSHKT